jgi:hypothetical protein
MGKLKKQEMENLFVGYEQALALKDLGFDEPCFGFYTKDKVWRPASYSFEGTNYPFNSVWPYTTAPLYQQAFKFFRDKYGLDYIIAPSGDSNLKTIGYYYEIPMGINISNIESEDFKSYEEAELACLKKLIEIANTRNEK